MGRRARPENTESKGHARERGRSIIFIADKSRKMPTIIKRVAKNRYTALLLSLTASMAKKAPMTTNKNERNIETREMPSIKPSRKLIPIIIKRRPVKNTKLAVKRRNTFGIIPNNKQIWVSCQWAYFDTFPVFESMGMFCRTDSAV